jgi:asparagine synthase (glutamine-hydrolysing)
MCGIAGILNLAADSVPVEKKPLETMIASLRHRGPDESGIYLDDHIGLAQSRLSIIDLSGGSQPMCNEDKTLWAIFNGEIFNYKELFPELIAKGHHFHTHSDTETILHAYEQYGSECVHHFNGQFAFALWDTRKRQLFCARDRIGIRPLHYTVHNGRFIFASEIKAIFSLSDVPRRLDPIAMDQVFTFWTTLPGKTVFENIFELPPGHTLTIKAGQVHINRFWRIPFCSHRDKLTTPLPQLVEQTNALLHDAIRLRLRADVPVGCYLSGGIDSSGITARVVRDFDSHVHTFGIRFQEAAFDEGDHQQLMVKRLGVHHTELLASNQRIGQAFRQTVAAAEKPLLRTGPVPLYLLSGVVHDAGMKVVLTGEGADEFFGGYDIFRETRIRRCLARFPDSSRRQALIEGLYPDIFRDAKTRASIQSFFTKGLDTVGHPLFSHLIRWENTRRTRLFFSDDLKARIGDYDAYDDLTGQLPREFSQWDYFSRAQYLESDIFLSNYLLSSQGDRVAMAHSLEIRVPFLDYRIMEFLARVPTRWKILGTKEKYLLKKVFSDTLPQEILWRRKQPYRAPIVQSLLKTQIADHLDALSDSAVRKAGLFDSTKVGRLVTKLNASQTASEVDSMALAGVLSTQLLYADLVEKPYRPDAAAQNCTLLIDNRSGADTIKPRS